MGMMIALLTIGCGYQETTENPATKQKKDPNLIWSDEFNTLSKWKWDLVKEPSWKPAKRKQYYLPRNLSAKKGILTINLKKETYKGDPYTSGSLHTKLRKPFHYGRIEIRAKAADGHGLLSALWLQPTDRSEFPEIDIMEVLGQEPNQHWNVVHWEDKKKNRMRNFTYTDSPKPLTKGFHTYGIIWKKDRLTFTLDGKVTHVMTKNVPKKPMFLMMNVSVGGQWATDPKPKQKFPQKMQIDYVRYYKK